MIEIPPPCTLGGWVGYYNYVELYSYLSFSYTQRVVMFFNLSSKSSVFEEEKVQKNYKNLKRNQYDKK